MASSVPSYAEVWVADLNPVRGHQQAGRRPVLVVSTDRFNHGPASLVIVVPFTTRDRAVPLRVRVDPPEGGMHVRSFAICEMVRSISRDRLSASGPLGAVSAQTMRQVVEHLRMLIPPPA